MDSVCLISDAGHTAEWIENSEGYHQEIRNRGLGFLLELMARVAAEGPYTHGELVDKMLAVAPGFDRLFFDQLLWLVVGPEVGRHLFRKNAEGHLHSL